MQIYLNKFEIGISIRTLVDEWNFGGGRLRRIVILEHKWDTIEIAILFINWYSSKLTNCNNAENPFDMYTC